MGARVHIFVGVLILAVLSGCATYPISKELQKQATSTTLGQVMSDPAMTQGAIVIWGGRIIDTINDTNGGSIYIMDLALDSDGKPISYSLTDGRFIATSRGFLDPEAYPKGGLITVAGQIQGVRTEPIQKMRYNYPVLAIRQVYVWPRQAEGEYYYYPGYYGYWYPWYPWWYGGVVFVSRDHGAFHRSGGEFHGEEFHGGAIHGNAFHGGGSSGHSGSSGR